MAALASEAAAMAAEKNQQQAPLQKSAHADDVHKTFRNKDGNRTPKFKPQSKTRKTTTCPSTATADEPIDIKVFTQRLQAHIDAQVHDALLHTTTPGSVLVQATPFCYVLFRLPVPTHAPLPQIQTQIARLLREVAAELEREEDVEDWGEHDDASSSHRSSRASSSNATVSQAPSSAYTSSTFTHWWSQPARSSFTSPSPSQAPSPAATAAGITDAQGQLPPITLQMQTRTSSHAPVLYYQDSPLEHQWQKPKPQPKPLSNTGVKLAGAPGFDAVRHTPLTSRALSGFTSAPSSVKSRSQYSSAATSMSWPRRYEHDLRRTVWPDGATIGPPSVTARSYTSSTAPGLALRTTASDKEHLVHSTSQYYGNISSYTHDGALGDKEQQAEYGTLERDEDIESNMLPEFLSQINQRFSQHGVS